MKRIALLLSMTFVLIITSCSEYNSTQQLKPEDLIEEGEFTNIMFDMRLSEVIIRQDVTTNNGNDADSISKKQYNFVFKKHNISSERFQRSLVYYTNNPMVLDEINNAVVDSLNILKELIKTPQKEVE